MDVQIEEIMPCGTVYRDLLVMPDEATPEQISAAAEARAQAYAAFLAAASQQVSPELEPEDDPDGE